jgi:CBS domain-containing protein
MERTVADVMSTDLVVAIRSTPYKELVRRMRERGVNALPIVDSDRRLLGIVTETDLAFKQEYRPAGQIPFLEGTEQRRQRRKAAATVAQECMSDPVAVIGPDATVPTAARLLHRKGVHHLPVVDADGRLVGIVSRRDLLGAFLRPDEEIRRQIRIGVLGVTFDVPEGEVDVQVDEGVVTLNGKVERRSLVREIVTRTRAVEGVVSVVDRLEYRHDDRLPVRPSRPAR